MLFKTSPEFIRPQVKLPTEWPAFVASVMSDSVTSLIIAHQAPLFVGLSKQEHWSGFPCPPPADPPDPGIKLGSPALQADSLPLSHQGSLAFL